MFKNTSGIRREPSIFQGQNWNLLMAQNGSKRFFCITCDSILKLGMLHFGLYLIKLRFFGGCYIFTDGVFHNFPNLLQSLCLSD